MLDKTLSVQGIKRDCGMTFETFQLAGHVLDNVRVSNEVIYHKTRFPYNMLRTWPLNASGGNMHHRVLNKEKSLRP